jgi:hypothetical protein
MRVWFPLLPACRFAHAGYGTGVFDLNYLRTLKKSLSSVAASVSPTAE